MGKLRIISIILVVVLFSLSCGSMEYDTAQKFINNCKYKITMFGSNTIRYANSYEIKDGFVIIEEYASDTWVCLPNILWPCFDILGFPDTLFVCHLLLT